MFSSFMVLLRNEVRTLLRARIALFWVFVFPLFFLAMMLLSYGNHGAFGAAQIETVDLDRSAASAAYLEQVRRVFSGGDPIHGEVRAVDPQAAMRPDAVRVVVPRGFGAAAAALRPVAVELRYDFGAGLSTQIAMKVFKPLTLRYNAGLSAAPMPVSLVLHNAGTGAPLEFPLYMLTGILVMSMMTAGMNSTCIGIAEMRERNIFKFMSTLPMPPSTYLAALLTARLIVIFIASYVLLFAGRFLFQLPVPLAPGRLLVCSVVLAIGGTMLIAAGLALSSRMRTTGTAVLICNFVYLVLLFASDLTMPLSSLSPDARALLSQLPVSQFAATVRAALIDGSPLTALGMPLAMMSVWALGFMALARSLFFWHKN